MKATVTCVCSRVEPDPSNARLLRATFVSHGDSADAKGVTLFASLSPQAAGELAPGAVVTLTVEAQAPAAEEAPAPTTTPDAAAQPATAEPAKV